MTFRKGHVLLSGMAAFVLAAGLLLIATTRHSQADKLIQQKIAALRAAGERITAHDASRIFTPPPPERDAAILLSNALEFAAMNRPSYTLTPIIGSAPMPARNEALDERVLAALRRYFEDTAEITNLVPVLPPGTRFGNHWELGILNTPIVPFVKIRSLMQLLCTRALYAAEVGDAESASRMLAQAFEFSTAIPAESTLVEHMIRVACLGLACKVTERCLNRTVLDDGQLRRILDAMPAPDTNDIMGTLRVESCFVMTVFQEVKDGRRLSSYTPSKKMPWWETHANKVGRQREET